MKNFKIINYLLIAASGLMFMQCTSDYTTIPGKDGENGTNGTNGTDGIDGIGTQVCVDCHSAEHREPIYDAYAMTAHANGSSWARGTSQGCAQCHNNQGYIDLLSGLYYDAEGYPTANLDPTHNPYQTSSGISCNGCHDDHRSFDFDNDGNDYALRNIDPVHTLIDRSVTLDMTNSVDPLGTSNTCINCHQPRPEVIPSGTGNYTITSQRFGPHHGPQSTVLEGIFGANYAGSVAYPGRGSAGHKTGASCVACHMGESSNGEDGGHSWEPTLKTCVACHTSMTAIPTEIADFSTNFGTLHNLLVSKGYISESGSVLGANGGNASGSNPLVVPVKEAQAIWNYKTIEEDKSNGIHNPKYVRALIQNSIEALQN